MGASVTLENEIVKICFLLDEITPFLDAFLHSIEEKKLKCRGELQRTLVFDDDLLQYTTSMNLK